MKLCTFVTGMRRRLKQRWCKHDWRPGKTTLSLVRWCGKCDKKESLTGAEMYAHFGVYPKEIPWR